MARFAPHPSRRPAVVTGASSGIGAATALALGAAGLPVVLGARRADRCEELAEQIRGGGGEAWALPLDVSDPASVDSFAKQAEALAGPIEVIVSNAGDVLPLAATEATAEQFAAQVAVNLLGPQHLIAALGPAMVERGRGDIVMVTSDVTERPRPYMAGYVAAKSGLEGLADAMRLEMEGTGVRVGVVRPGPTATEQGSGWPSEQVDRVMSEWTRFGLIRHHGYLLPEQVAAAVVAMVAAPRGSQFSVIEVQPEAPLRDQGERP